MRIKSLKKHNKRTLVTNDNQPNDETDEEELTLETEWIKKAAKGLGKS